jgi:hypothetical protein
MSVFLDSIDVTGLIIADSFPSGINSVTEYSVDGSIIVFEKNINDAVINLVGGSDWGWLELSILRSIQDLAKVIGANYTLDHEGTLYTVRFRNEDPPSVYGERLINRSNQAVTDYYNNIIIKLMEI